MSQTIPSTKLDRSHIAPVTTREELIYLLSRAAELEHGLACIYLLPRVCLRRRQVMSGSRHFEDFVNNKKAEVIRHNMTPDFYDHDGPVGKPAGVEDDENMMRRMYDLMPGMQITIEDMVAEGDKVVCRNIWRWKDAKSGTPMEFHGFVQWRFEGNQIAERWATVTPPREASDSCWGCSLR